MLVWTFQVSGGGLTADLLILSQVDFEAAAQSVMTETLREVKRLRPKALWGVSPFPSCYNGNPAQTILANYTGQCPAAEMALNDELLWLWKRCSALYPLLTLEKLQVGYTTLLCFFLYLFAFLFWMKKMYKHFSVSLTRTGGHKKSDRKTKKISFESVLVPKLSWISAGTKL